MSGLAGVDGVLFGGAIAGDDALGGFVGAASAGGTMAGATLLGGGGFGGAAGDGGGTGVIGVAIFASTGLGTRTDFLHRLQSKIFTVALASMTMGAAQCGQSKRISLLAVPVFDVPPFCTVGNGSSRYTIIATSQVGAPGEISSPDFVPTRRL